MLFRSSAGKGSAFSAAHHEGHDPDNQEDQEQDLGNTDGFTSDAAKAKHAGDDRDDEKHKGPMEHRSVGWSL